MVSFILSATPTTPLGHVQADAGLQLSNMEERQEHETRSGIYFLHRQQQQLTVRHVAGEVCRRGSRKKQKNCLCLAPPSCSWLACVCVCVCVCACVRVCVSLHSVFLCVADAPPACCCQSSCTPAALHQFTCVSPLPPEII